MGRGGKGDREKRKITRGGECANGSRGKTGGEGSKSVVAWLFRRIPQKCLMTNLSRKFGFRDLYWNSSYRQMEGRIAVQL